MSQQPPLLSDGEHHPPAKIAQANLRVFPMHFFRISSVRRRPNSTAAPSPSFKRSIERASEAADRGCGRCSGGPALPPPPGCLSAWPSSRGRGESCCCCCFRGLSPLSISLIRRRRRRHMRGTHSAGECSGKSAQPPPRVPYTHQQAGRRPRVADRPSGGHSAKHRDRL